MPILNCENCGKYTLVRGPGRFRCLGCRNYIFYDPGPDPWYIKWTRAMCFTHLIVQALFIPVALIVEFVAGILTLGMGWAILAAHIAAIPFCLLVGLVPLLLVDLWRSQAKQ